MPSPALRKSVLEFLALVQYHKSVTGNGKSVKFLLCGDWRWPQYEQAFADALTLLGHVVVPFEILRYLRAPFGLSLREFPLPFMSFLQLNRCLLRVVDKERPNFLLAWRCTHLFPRTIRRVGDLGVCTVSYNNDDPFGPKSHKRVPWHHHFLWYWYIRGLRYYRYNFFYRAVNVIEARGVGAMHAEVMLPYFIPGRDRPLALTEYEKARYGCEAVFVGHYEPDGREKYLTALVDSGLVVKLFGDNGWSPRVLGKYFSCFAPIFPVEGDEYAKALCGANVCLAFLSKLNRDTYTRRCFEIPACGRPLLAERSQDLCKLFKEDQEACFFSSTAELVEKATWLSRDSRAAAEIALAGQRRVWQGGHDVHSRVRQFADVIGAS